MKLMFASDIHGSEYYAKKIIETFQEEECDRLILLGDLLYHGPRNPLTKEYNPQGVANLLNTLKDKTVAVRGNCDSEVDQMVLEFPMMADYTQVVVDDYTFFLTHGHLFQPDELPESDKTVFVFGHIHLPVLEKENVFILNPGSVSLPKGGYAPSYAVYENHLIQIKTFDHEVIKELNLN